MTDARVPVLWLTGPAGVGKTTVAWEIFTGLASAGVRVAFAEADQLGMCFPAPAGDQDREHFKAQNFGALVRGYRAAGAQCVIANGWLDPGRGLDRELMPQAEVTVCRLRAEPAEVSGRLTGRDGPGVPPAETACDVEAMDASDVAGVCIDTTGVAADSVAGLVRDSCRGWPGFSGSLPPAAPVADGDSGGGGGDGEGGGGGGGEGGDGGGGEVLLICGPPGAGKSTIGFQLLVRYVGEGRMTGFVDLDQIGFVRPGPDGDPGRHRLKAGNLAAVWRTYRSGGATHLIATGPIDNQAAVQEYVRALPAAKVVVCRLHAGPADLTSRILSRGEGGSWPQPGDPLRGQPAGYLRQVAADAVRQAHDLEEAGIGTVRIDTSGRDAGESAALIAAAHI